MGDSMSIPESGAIALIQDLLAYLREEAPAAIYASAEDADYFRALARTEKISDCRLLIAESEKIADCRLLIAESEKIADCRLLIAESEKIADCRLLIAESVGAAQFASAHLLCTAKASQAFSVSPQP